MSSFAETELLNACRVLFGSDVRINRDFLYYIQPCGVKSAYRRRAKQTHPDAQAAAADDTDAFVDVNHAYKMLSAFSADKSTLKISGADSAASYSAAPQRPTYQPPRQQRYQARREPPPRQDKGASALPQRQLEIGMYLYYRGVITYAEMIEALVWQRRQRPIIGSIAEHWGWLSAAQIRRINSFHGRHSRFGRRAVELGCLSEFQVQVLLRHQRQIQKRYGQYFVEQGILSNYQLERYIYEQQLHNSRCKPAQR